MHSSMDLPHRLDELEPQLFHEAEDLDLNSRRQWGNFHQAYSHLALIDTALALDELEKRNGEETLLNQGAC